MDLTLAANWSQILSCFVGAVGVVLAALSLWLYLRSRQRRALACAFQLIEFPLEIEADERYKGDLEIRYKGEAIENLFLVRARLRNTGNQPILESEVVEPLIFVFDPGTTLLRTPIVVGRKPDNLKIEWEDSKLPERFASFAGLWPFTFDLLNSGDEFTAEFLCTGEVASPKAKARIVGISEIGVLDPEEMRMREMVAGIRSIFFLIVVFVVAFGLAARFAPVTWLADAAGQVFIPLILSVPFALAIYLWNSVTLARYRKRKRESSV